MRAAIVLLGGLAGLWASPAAAQTGFYLPNAPTSYGQDEFRAADGTTCRSSMDGTKRVELGTYGTGNQSPSYGTSAYGYGYGYNNAYVATPLQGNAGVYARFTMSLDARPDRMDCNKLFELEMEKRRLEVEILKRSLVAADRQLDDLKALRLRGGDERGSALPDPPPETKRAVSSRARPKQVGERRQSAPL